MRHFLECIHSRMQGRKETHRQAVGIFFLFKVSLFRSWNGGTPRPRDDTKKKQNSRGNACRWFEKKRYSPKKTNTIHILVEKVFYDRCLYFRRENPLLCLPLGLAFFSL